MAYFNINYFPFILMFLLYQMDVLFFIYKFYLPAIIFKKLVIVDAINTSIILKILDGSDFNAYLIL